MKEYDSMELYDYFFHFNPYRQLWSAVPRNSMMDYVNGIPNEQVLTSSKIETLIEIVSRGEEFIKSIESDSEKHKTEWCFWITVKDEEPSQSNITNYCFDNEIKLISFVKQYHSGIVDGELVDWYKSPFNWYIKVESNFSSIQNFKKHLMNMPEVMSFFEELREV